ncbi:hypothetical protein BC629DRAFT_1597600 [Irpex lacteus]|nr:hypothetical protein BC629DRAFT_1597600 [Irpex lacteus]
MAQQSSIPSTRRIIAPAPITPATTATSGTPVPPPSPSYMVVCRICTSAIDPSQDSDSLCKISCGHVFHSACIQDRINVSELTASTAQCPLCETGFQKADVQRVFIDYIEAEPGSSAAGQVSAARIPEYIISTHNNRLEALGSEQRVTQLQINAISTQVTAIEQERDGLHAYYDHITTRGLQLAWLVDELERKKAEILRRLN